jgi:hypothetical protein
MTSFVLLRPEGGAMPGRARVEAFRRLRNKALKNEALEERSA